jgi:hypothetical protein
MKVKSKAALITICLAIILSLASCHNNIPCPVYAQAETEVENAG